jgi:hypothetical protein
MLGEHSVIHPGRCTFNLSRYGQTGCVKDVGFFCLLVFLFGVGGTGPHAC